jgi:hypothetical protein
MYGLARSRVALAMLLGTVVVSLGGQQAAATRLVDCRTTPRVARAPNENLSRLSRSWWRVNGVWAGVAGAFHGEGFRALPTGQKIGWYRERPGALRLFGKRLDGPPADFGASIPCCYGLRGFQSSGVTFGAAGCWAVTAIVGAGKSRFVVRVAPA